jgi:deoxyribonuclease-2
MYIIILYEMRFVFQTNEDLAVVLYNDQPPGIQPTLKDGHTKGIVIANSLGGFWMPHSIPRKCNVNDL